MTMFNVTEVTDFYDSNEFVRDLREIDRRGRDVNASIPADVIEAIDKGRNPEICTFQMLYVLFVGPYN